MAKFGKERHTYMGGCGALYLDKGGIHWCMYTAVWGNTPEIQQYGYLLEPISNAPISALLHELRVIIQWNTKRLSVLLHHNVSTGPENPDYDIVEEEGWVREDDHFGTNELVDIAYE
jgi:hypothetical protein